MNARHYWNSYVKRVGGTSEVARQLQIPYQTIRSVCTGHRGIGKALAERMAAADPQLDPQVLVWVMAGLDHSSPAPKKRKRAA